MHALKFFKYNFNFNFILDSTLTHSSDGWGVFCEDGLSDVDLEADASALPAGKRGASFVSTVTPWLVLRD